MTARRSGGGDTLSLRALSRATLARQMLLGREAMKPVSAIERLVGLQAQWPRQAFIGLWTRLEGFRRDDLLGALSARKAVRVTAMRSTLHVMSAKDYVGMRAPLARALSKNLQAIVGKRLASVDLETVVSIAKAGFASDPQTFEEMRDRLVRRFPDGDERAMGYAARLSVPLVQVPTTDAWGFPASPQFVEAETWLGKPLRVDDDPAPIVSRYLAAFGPASIADVQKLAMSLDVNGQRRQTGSTATMIFGINYLLHYITQFMVLEPGDVVTTGTPPGVALGMKPPVWLKPGDAMTVKIEGLGQQNGKVVAFKE